MPEKLTPHYTGDAFADLLRHDGALPHAVGASNYQVLRANRKHPEWAEDLGYTYNHGPMLTYWRDHFYLEYLSVPVDEHVGPGCSLLVKSADGMDWAQPQVCFPEITIPAGRYECHDGTVIQVPEDKCAFMHQRMGFFHTSDDRLLVSGFYGHAPHHDICPWQSFGMGRAVREVFEDGAMGPIHFIRFLDYSGWTEEKLPFPYYKRSGDASFVAACEELLADHLVTQQWREEHGWRDEQIGVEMPKVGKRQGIAANSPFESASSFCWYHVDEKTVMGLWKQGRVGRSEDGGKSFSINYEPSFATSGAKSWGQKTQDGRYAIAYVNSLSSEHRYPLVAVTSDDGVQFGGMACVCGEVPPRRYEGIYKDFGPQYIRGICEGHAQYPKGAFWLTHSMNKEDIFVTRVPVPVRLEVVEHISDTFASCPGGYIPDWNVYSTKWANVMPYTMYGTDPCMRIADRDPCDYARAMRIFPRAKQISISLDLMAAGQYGDCLEIEAADGRGTPACWVSFGGGWLRVKYGANTEDAFMIPAQPMWHRLEFRIDCADNTYAILFNDNDFSFGLSRLVHKVNDVERLVIRTKSRRHTPHYDIYPETPDMPGVEEPVAERVYFIKNVRTGAL
ncbi:MAG: hypothetical protein FWE98_00400 [Oscillospiraceae bacterium]|nr:hypothetical protein [Oscillospiraceae bacterium]